MSQQIDAVGAVPPVSGAGGSSAIASQVDPPSVERSTLPDGRIRQRARPGGAVGAADGAGRPAPPRPAPTPTPRPPPAPAPTAPEVALPPDTCTGGSAAVVATISTTPVA